ncbi:MAG: fibronectin type III domain-containing protein [Candidatus Moraniibacteriota bacterium]|nr:MAG: fibronectin type III domain-containing protein [Candidatus Moranbacteria bacterium]
MNNKAISLSAFIIVFFVGLLVTYTNLLPIGGVGQAHAINAALSVTPQCSGGSSGFSITFTVPDSNGGNGNNANGRWRVAPQSSPSSPYDSGDLYPAGTGGNFLSTGSSASYAPGVTYTVTLQSQFGVIWLQRNVVALNCATPPTIDFPSKQAYTPNGATLGGNVLSAGSGTWGSRGVCVGLSANPTTGCTSTTGTTGSFSVPVSGLNPNTTYNYRAYAENSAGRSYTTNDTFTTMANVPTGVNAVANGQTSINVSWTAPVGGAASYMLSWCDRTLSPGCSPSTNIAGVTSVHSHTGLTCGRTYAYVVKSINSAGNNDSPVVTATTAPCTSIPTVTLPTSTTPTSTTVTLGGTVTSNGGLTQDIRGVCYSLTSTNPNPVVGGSGVTCVNESTPNTGLFTRPVSGLTPGSSYSFVAYAHNSLGNGYSPVGTFTTPSIAPTSVVTNAESGRTSYKATFNGSANPNGSQAYGYFRYFTTVPNCTVDSGGTRVPSSSTLDFDLGSGNSPRTFNFTTSTSIPLVPNTNYWYCAYARNSAAGAGSPGTSISTGYRPFTTSDGGVSACDAPSSGNLTISEACTFPQSDYDGVDAGGGGTNNTGTITLLTGGYVTILPGQKIARGAYITNGGSFIIGNGNRGSIRAGVWLKDSDNDGAIDNPIVKVVSSTQPAGYIRRNYAYTLPTYNSTTFSYASRFYNAATNSPSYLDCNSTNSNIYRYIDTMVVDADGDGYKTATSGTTQCVGGTQTINGRTYYRNASGAYTWLSGGAALGGGAADCNDSSAAPCAPNSPSVSSTSQTSLTINWSASTGPLPATYSLFYCDRTANSSCTPNIQIGGTLATTSYVHNSGISCGRNYAYLVRGTNGSGTSPDSAIFTTPTSSCASIPTIISPTANPITTTGATLGGTISSDGGASITQRGICYSTTQSTPSLTNGSTCLQDGNTGNGIISLATSTLSSSTFYYFRIFATNSVGTGYSAVSNFTTNAALLANGSACSAGSQCSSGNCYVDADNDRYAPSSGSATCRANTQIAGNDCNDSYSTINPGAGYSISARPDNGTYDWNCSATIEANTSAANYCNATGLPNSWYSAAGCPAGSYVGGLYNTCTSRSAWSLPGACGRPTAFGPYWGDTGTGAYCSISNGYFAGATVACR